jgi:hypothetical protein
MSETRSDRAKEIPGLMARWRKKVGSPMPIDIAQLPIEKIRTAVKHIERGDIVCVPKGLSLGDPRQASIFGDDSMMENDQHGFY